MAEKKRERETETAGRVGSPTLIPIWVPAVLPVAALSSVQTPTKWKWQRTMQQYHEHHSGLVDPLEGSWRPPVICEQDLENE